MPAPRTTWRRGSSAATAWGTRWHTRCSRSLTERRKSRTGPATTSTKSTPRPPTTTSTTDQERGGMRFINALGMVGGLFIIAALLLARLAH
ncbi:hypothetical protein ABZ851_32925 [Streptomyces sp. NPDC047049]|uniref:hypothetical protein n=1 Tax=Streptomyces sp. NPDC047049 TaxID=3156688 RepID=UPI0033FB591D